MRKTAFTALTACLLAVVTMSPMLAQENKPPAPALSLKVGDMAPDFKLQYLDATGLKDVTLSQYRGQKNVALAFYIFAFTGG
jgi:AhpC/TSA family